MLRLSAVAVVAAALGFGVGWVATRPPPPPPPKPFFEPGSGPVVARWKGGTLTADQVRDRMDELVRAARTGPVSPDQRKAFAEEMLRTEMLADEALRAGLLSDPRVAAQVKQALARRYVEREFDEGLAKKEISEADLAAYYKAHLSEYTRPEKVHVLDLFVAAPADPAARKAKRKALEAQRKELAALDEAGFLAKAREAAGDPTAGDLGPLSRDEMQERVGPEFTQVAWLMVRLGEVSEVIETPAGFHLARLHTRLGALDTTFDQARATLRSRLWYERRAGEIEKAIAKLRASLEFTVDAAALEKALAGQAPVPPAP